MNKQEKHPYELAKNNVLPNSLLTRWLIDIEERLRRLESLSPNVTWEVSQDELAETEDEKRESDA